MNRENKWHSHSEFEITFSGAPQQIKWKKREHQSGKEPCISLIKLN